MSSNLVKHFFMTVPQDTEKRMIDSNELLRRRQIVTTSAEGRDASEGREDSEKGDGFVQGLTAAEIMNAPEDGSNVIKARDEAGEILEQAKAEAEEILAGARAEAEQICVQARAQGEAEKVQVIDQARQQGYHEGLVKAQAHEETVRKEYEEKARRLEEEYQQEVDRMEPRFVETITGIYEHIFNVELSSYREILTSLISNVMHKLDGSRSFIIHVSREDYSYVNMQKKQLLAGTVSESTVVDVVEDLTLGKNECMIETENGIFDCGLGTQLSELRNRLLLLAWQAV